MLRFWGKLQLGHERERGSIVNVLYCSYLHALFIMQYQINAEVQILMLVAFFRASTIVPC